MIELILSFLCKQKAEEAAVSTCQPELEFTTKCEAVKMCTAGHEWGERTGEKQERKNLASCTTKTSFSFHILRIRTQRFP